MKTNYLLLLLLFGIALLQVKAEEITVTVSDNLIDIVSGAANGDVIIIEPGLYKVNQTAISIIDKSLTIKGSDEEDKPLVYIKQISLGNTSGSTVPVGLTIENIEFSGYDVDSVTGEENVNGALTGAYFIDMTDSL
ncbi:MAG: hypothetical protein JXB49_20335, partial [Bacteroidales bacterium]|nr:hypothetical protein [Bacteroidales bacterium]